MRKKIVFPVLLSLLSALAHGDAPAASNSEPAQRPSALVEFETVKGDRMKVVVWLGKEGVVERGDDIYKIKVTGGSGTPLEANVEPKDQVRQVRVQPLPHNP